MAEILYQLYKTTMNGRTEFTVAPATNTPYGYSVATKADLKQAAVDAIQRAQTDLQNPGLNTQYRQTLLSSGLANMNPATLTDAQISQVLNIPQDTLAKVGTSSGMVQGPITATNTTGFYSSQAAADYAASHPQTPGMGTAGLATPPSGVVNQTLGSDAPQGGYTRDAQGNVYDAQGNHVTLDQLPKGPDGKPLMNLETLPLRDTSAGGAGPAGGAGAGGSQYVSIYRDNANNFYGVDAQGNKTKLTEAQAFAGGLGINATFVQPGQTVSLAQAQTGQAGAGGTGGGVSGLPAWADQNAIDGLKFMFGWSDDQAKQFIASNPDAKNFALTAEYTKRQSDLGMATAATNRQSFLDAYNQAVKEVSDPSSPLGAKYSDLKRTDIANFQQNIAYAQTNLDVASQQQQQQFLQQQKDLGEQYAAAGASYSGFKQQAKQQLAQSQSGVIQSTRAQIQQQLAQATQPLEQVYGSAQLGQVAPSAQLSYLNPLTGAREQMAYQPVGGLTGSLAQQKEQDILARQGQIYQTTMTPA